MLHVELASDDEASSEESAELLADVAKSWKELVNHGGVGSVVYPYNFISSDSYAVATEELDNYTIIESVQSKSVCDGSTESEQELEESVVKPTASEVMDAIDDLWRHASELSLEQALLALSIYSCTAENSERHGD